MGFSRPKAGSWLFQDKRPQRAFTLSPPPARGRARPAAPCVPEGAHGVPAAGLALAPGLSPQHDDSTPLDRRLACTSCSARKTLSYSVLLLKTNVGGTGEPGMNAGPMARPGGGAAGARVPGLQGGWVGRRGPAGTHGPPVTAWPRQRLWMQGKARHAGARSGQARSAGPRRRASPRGTCATCHPCRTHQRPRTASGELGARSPDRQCH